MLAVLAGGGWLAAIPALGAAVPFWIATLLVVRRHVIGLANLERRIDSMVAGEGDPRLESPTLQPLSFAVARLGRALQDRESVLAAGSATAFRHPELLRYLTEHPGRVFSREQLLDAVWGRDVYVEARTVDVHIRRLRKALNAGGAPDYVRTVRAAGYALECPE